MTPFRLAAAVLLLSSGAAFAQDAAPAQPPAPAAAAAPGAPPAMTAVRASCRDEVGKQNLRGDPRRQAMVACIVRQRPDMESRMNCQLDPSLKGMDKDARRAAVRACVLKARG